MDALSIQEEAYYRYLRTGNPDQAANYYAALAHVQTTRAWGLSVSGAETYFLTEKERDEAVLCEKYDDDDVIIRVHNPYSPWSYWYEPSNIILFKFLALWSKKIELK